MALGIKWSRKDRASAQKLIKAIADKAGGWQSLADKLGMEADSSRATVQAWHRRGRVSLEYAAPVRNIARELEIPCELGELNPQAKHVEAVQ